MSTELGDGQPVSIKLTYRKRADRPEGRPLFGSSGQIAIKQSDFGNNFGDRVADEVRRVRGNDRDRKRALARLVAEGDLLELDEDEIVGCSAVVRSEGKYRTVYFLGENANSTRFPLRVAVGIHGDANRQEIAAEMVRVMRESIMPLLHNARPA